MVNFIIISFEENDERGLLEKCHVSSGLLGSMTKTSSSLLTSPSWFFLRIKFSLWILDVNGKYSLTDGDVLHFLLCSNPVVEGGVQSVVHCMTWARFCKQDVKLNSILGEVGGSLPLNVVGDGL